MRSKGVTGNAKGGDRRGSCLGGPMERSFSQVRALLAPSASMAALSVFLVACSSAAAVGPSNRPPRTRNFIASRATVRLTVLIRVRR